MKHTSLKLISIVILIIPVLVLSGCGDKALRRDMKKEKKAANTKNTEQPTTNCYFTKEYCTDEDNRNKDKCHPAKICETCYPQNKCCQEEIFAIGGDKYYVSHMFWPEGEFHTLSQFDPQGKCVREETLNWKEKDRYLTEACNEQNPFPIYPIGKLCYNVATINKPIEIEEES